MRSDGPAVSPYPLEEQYLFRARHPDREAIYRQQAELSRKARETLPYLADLPYAEVPQAKLDVFPATQAGAPTLLFFHGGYWRSNRKEDFAFLAPPLVAAGATLVLVGYPLVPAATLGEIADCAVTALRWSLVQLPLWQGDAGRLFVAGHSAGGQLAAFVATTPWGSALRGCLALSGLFDLAPLQQTSLAAELRLGEAEVESLSPIKRLAQAACPLHLFVGGAETQGFLDQTARFAAAARAAGQSVSCEVLPTLHHYSIVLSLADCQSRLFGAFAHHLGLDLQRDPSTAQ